MWEDSKDTVALSLINPKNKFRFCCLTFQNSLSVSFRSIKFNYVEETHDLGSFLTLAKIVASSQHKIWRKNYFVMQDFMAKFQRASEAPYLVFFLKFTPTVRSAFQSSVSTNMAAWNQEKHLSLILLQKRKLISRGTQKH